MWHCITVGECVLVEMPSRWYVGVVKERNSVTATLTKVVCCHDLGDLGLFLEGKASAKTGAEMTPLPGDKEINLGSVDTAEPFPAAYLQKYRRRTHSPLGEAVT